MPHANQPILPGATLGMLGGGQLGRLFTVAARGMGYRVMVLDPDASSPAGQLADVHLCTAYDDPASWAQLTQHCAAITTEFENISAEILHALAKYRPVRPGAEAVAVVQHRVSEKRWLQAQGIATAAFAVIAHADDVAAACSTVGFPAILKVARFGYDGKGQARVANRAEVDTAFAELGGEVCVLEQQIALQCELSVVLGRNAPGQTACFPVAENIHAQGILDMSIVPARISPALADLAQQTALSIAQSLHYCGVLGVEFFVTTEGKLLVNELAPRPHNSGHFTLDACLTSQFELQVRALCNLPLGATAQHTPAVMVNLLGDLWGQSQPNWQVLMQHPCAKLHLYGKVAARPGRKMGHFTCLADTVDEALALAQDIRHALPAVTDAFRR
uniref:Putative Phosphoribosylaminoimidazole carboxylase PurK n=1 Tax=mine drainage metagenome TaxID=410659 RepID=E6QUV4_9ZZZZ